MNNNYQKKIRIAKFLSSKGYGSRREIEQLIQKNKIIVNKEIISSPITFVSAEDEIINIQYAPFEYKLLKKGNANSWVEFHMREGKNNEIRNLCAAINLKVNRLIRLEYGPFKLKNLLAGKVEKAEEKEMRLYEDHIRKI
jgi:23S rRNA pseudouridine2605 synthase